MGKKNKTEKNQIHRSWVFEVRSESKDAFFCNLRMLAEGKIMLKTS